jgi:glucan phosphoethanolaminetransferase (alkaline phosphatase superfamily)
MDPRHHLALDRRAQAPERALIARGLPRIAVAAIAAALLAALIAYGALALIGLHFWGQVVSWELITTYGAQAPRLAEVIGVSLAAVAGAALLVYCTLFAAAWMFPRTFVCASGVALAAGLGSFAAQSPEPALDFQGHTVERQKAARLDTAEDAARQRYQPAAAAERRNLILIVVDALRPDHMGLYGYGRDTTPTLARLEREGRLRKSAALRAACASSVCGLVALSSSRYVHQLSARPITLQEVLRRHGYRVHMVLSGDHTSFYGLKQTYGEVDSYFDAATAGAGRYVNDDRLALDRLAAFPQADATPVMIQLHLMSAHPIGRRDPALARYTPEANYAPIAFSPDAAAPAIESAINYYDNGVLQADATIGLALDTLERKGYLGNALVAVTADHGELLGEHGLFRHANSVYEEALRVPLVLLSYGYRPAGSLDGHAVASQIDIAPTLLAELAMPLPETWRGIPLQSPGPRNFVYFQQRREAGLFDLRDAGNLWKYWVDLRSGEEHAFNLTRDPAERVNAIERIAPPLKREWRLELLGRM